MERDDRSPVATFFARDIPALGVSVALSDVAAHHARVKRLVPGDPIRLTTGAGTIALGDLASLTKTTAEVHVRHIERIPREVPIHLRVPIGDRDRMLWLVEKATEFGIATWQSIRFRRSMSVTPRGEGPAFAEKVRARMIAALEQSGGAWLPDIVPDAGDPTNVSTPADARRMLLDAAGSPLFGDATMPPFGERVILFGPEGGLERDEREALIDAGWRLVRLATNTLRFETAGLAAIAAIRATQVV